MKKYWVNNKAQDNGDHEVHCEGCEWMPQDATYLGMFSNCHDAVIKAKKTYLKSDGCFFCCRECHTR